MARWFVLAILLVVFVGASCGIDERGAAVSSTGGAGVGGSSGVSGSGGFPVAGAGGLGGGSGGWGGGGGQSGAGEDGAAGAGGAEADASNASDGTTDTGPDSGPLGPSDIPGLVVWLRSDLGVTTADATVADPSMLSAASWMKANCTATAVTLTESVDGAPKAHMAYQLVQDLQLGHSAHFTIGVPQASGGGRYPAVVPNGGASVVFLDAQAGVILKASNVSSPTYVNGVLEFDVTVTSKHLALYITADGVNLTHTGDGTHTATFTNVAVKQRTVSAWADQSGKGHDAVQGTEGKRPLFAAQGPGGWPSLVGNGADFLVTSPVDLTTATGSTWFAVLFDGSGAPQVVFEHGAAGGASGARLGVNAGAPGRLASTVRGATSAPKTLLSSADTFDLDTGSVLVGIHDASLPGASEMQLWWNGVNISGTSSSTETTGGFGSSPLTLFAQGGGVAGYAGGISEIGLYNRALTAQERVSLTTYLGTRYGIPVP